MSAGSLQHASQESIFAVKLDKSNRSHWSALVPSSLVQLKACAEQDAPFPTLRAKAYYYACLVAPIPALPYDDILHSCFMKRASRLLDKDH